MTVGGSLLTALATVGGTASSIALLAALKDRPPVRWLLERLVVQPAEEALDRKIDTRVGAVLAPTVAQVEAIYHEMHPNSGLSMRDVVDRTEHRVASTLKKVDSLDGKVDTVNERVSRVEGQVDILARDR
jgi:hypothetical protein